MKQLRYPWLAPARAGLLTLFLGVFFAAPAAAQGPEPAFPPALRVGLVPPADFVLNPALPGFQHKEKRAEIRLAELPGYAFEMLEKQMAEELAKTPPTAVRLPITLAQDGIRAILAKTAQTSPQGPVLQWMMVAHAHDVTAIATVLIPEAIAEVASEEAVLQSLASLAIRPAVPVEEQLSALPFAMADLAGYRILRVQPGVAAMLTEGEKDVIENAEQAMLLISIAPAPTQPRPEERDGLARRLLTDTPGLTEMRVTRSEPLRIAGQQGHEIMVDAKDADGKHDVGVVQWLRFGAGTILRIVGIARKDAWDEHYNRFRQVRDGIGPR